MPGVVIELHLLHLELEKGELPLIIILTFFFGKYTIYSGYMVKAWKSEKKFHVKKEE